ncbi:hypothetical protein [Actinomadura sp. HBU206391]|uniref:hypothetical protein n=1 Tax=Actinomadura sp. HBU206391 TaxID=2731692 RepID=UPI00164F7199|nr:hypothetical protein [Actinomadura sp. HBU206391]MBC6459498.1 hypothetical protein [Actinomadura sp. HBU206391]
MPEDVDRHYRELVRLAYLVLPGRRRRIYRLAIARRIVDESLPRRPGRNPGRAYARARTRVLRRAIVPSWRLQVMLGPWLRALPARLPDPALTVALARLNPAARAAYVLLRVESLPRHTVRDQLVEAGVRDARAALEAADAAPDVAPPSLEPIVGPAVRRRSRLPIAAAAALTLILVSGFVITRSDPPSRPDVAHRLRVTTAGASDWNGGGRSLAVWPPRGALVRDTALVDRALAAWTRQMGARRDPQLLFAGRAGGTAVVLLRDGDRVGRYTDAHGVLEVSSVGETPGPLALGAGRYLLPPWITGASRAGSDKRVSVRDGVTESERVGAGCGRGPLLRLRQPGGSRTVADLGGPALTEMGYRTRSGETGSAASAVRLWERLACALPQPARPAASATAWEFWSGRLPGGTRGHWICTRYTFPDGASTAYGILFAGRTREYTTGDCGHEPDGAVSGTWRRSGGRWYYLAAASGELTPHAAGVDGKQDMRDGLLVVKGRRTEHPPAKPVILTARPEKS